MSKAYDFLRECGSFFVLTINGDYPAGRPFGAVIEVGEDLYLSTNDMNQAHKQMRENEHIQIIAKKRGMLISKGEADTERAAIMLLDEFRAAKLGRITLEFPN